MNYWLDVFTEKTWQQFREAGGTTSGFSLRRQKIVSQIKPGDILLCYLAHSDKLWVGALEVIGPSQDIRSIWTDEEFSLRLEVRPLVQLEPNQGVQLNSLKEQVTLSQRLADPGLKGMVRASPNRFTDAKEGELIFKLLQKADQNPAKLIQPSLFGVEHTIGKKKVETLVSVPPKDDHVAIVDGPSTSTEEASNTTRHTEIQYHLLKLGADMGLDIWVARNDRSRIWNGQPLGQLPGLIQELPIQFNEATQRTIELIDVLWLKDNTFLAAFEVECTTSIYSGLLRMNDLLALQPNIDIKLYLVSPDERRDKVAQEIQRPTFKLQTKSLQKVCGFLAFSKLMEQAEGIFRLGHAASLRPQFLQNIAEYFGRTDTEVSASMVNTKHVPNR